MKNNKEARVRSILSHPAGWEKSDEEIAVRAGCSVIYVYTLRQKFGPPSRSGLDVSHMEGMLTTLIELYPRRLLVRLLDQLGLIEYIISSVEYTRLQHILRRRNEARLKREAEDAKQMG